jgi:two-component system cell cycle sensor histidine kinase/response regulator CckA
MPGISGVELIERVRGKRPDIRVLLISGYSEDTHPWQGSPAVGETVLQKPFSSAALAATVRTVLDRASVTPARVGG